MLLGGWTTDELCIKYRELESGSEIRHRHGHRITLEDLWEARAMLVRVKFEYSLCSVKVSVSLGG